MKTPSNLNLLTGILESSKESVIFALDCNYCYLAFNENHRQTIKNIWGVDIKVGDNMLDFIKHPEDRHKAKINFDRALNGESFIEIEEYGDASINRRWYQNEYNPLFDDSGTVTGLTVFLSDITEQKQAEEELRKSEAKFRSFVENSKDLIYTLDKDRVITYISPNCENILGYTPDEMVATSIDNFIHPEDQEKSERRRDQLLEQGNIEEELEVRVKAKNGGWKWVAVKTNIIKRADYDVTILGTARDVTERKELEQELKLKSHMLDTAPGSIIVHDFNGNLYYANQRAVDLHGSTKEEFMNMKLHEFHTSESLELIPSRMEEVDKKGEANFETETYRKDGTTFPLYVYAKKIEWHGKPAILSIGTDITERKQIEETLKQSEEKFRAYLENAPVGIFVVDGKGNFIEVNREACRMRGYTEEELLNLRISDIVHPDYAQLAREHFEKVKNEGSSEGILLGQRKDGDLFWYDIYAVKVSENMFISFQTDVTERVERESKLQENEEKFRTLFEQNMLAIYLHDFDGNIIDVNKEACSQLGYDREELLNMSVFDFIRTKEFGGYLTKQEILSIWNQMELGERTTVEDMHQRQDGSVIHVEVSTGVIKYNNRRVIMALIQDITERKQAEEELKENEERFQRMLSLIPDMVSIQDPDMNIIYSNWNGFAEIPEERRVLNTKCYRTYRGYEDICPDCQAKTVLYTKEPFQVEREIMEGLWVDLRVIPMLDKDGNVEYFVEWVRDITNIKKSEEALKEKEELLREYFDKSPAGINIINKKGDYLDANFVTTQVLGCTKEELLSQNIFDFVETPYHEMIKNWFPLLEEQGYVTGEVMVSTKLGKRIWTEIHAAKLDKDRILLFSIDINERKQAEESILYLAFHDSLTGLFNRNYFDRELTNIDHERQLPLGVIMADINGLKLINDTYGQNVGDEVLNSAADTIRKSCREEDIIIRWGGDEFVILLPEVSIVEIENIKKRIKNNSKDVFVKDIPISLSLGSEIKEKKIDLKIEEVIKKAEDNMQKKKLAESRSVRNSVLKAILNTLQAKSYETEAHTQRMLMVAWEIGEKLEFPEDELNRLKLVITLHDIGKINISETILTKKGKLTDEEWEEMKKHPEIGYKIAKSTDEFSNVAEEILSHHERWDGRGYPGGLKGKEIPLLARITAIVDAYEVMSNGRPYKDPMPQDKIIAEFRRCAGTQFDPELTEVFIDLLKNQLEI